MLFRVLGPLEVVDRGTSIALGGMRQRATLAFLLLNANRVVPASALLEALWPGSEMPVTSRKILQNAVWSLRRMLGDHPVDHEFGLVTRPPGYMVQVAEDSVDLSVFRRRAREGRLELISGSPAAAADTLRSALDLWRGAALADLVEAGTMWPELAAAESSRLDAAEDYFEAELRCGRHQVTLGALERMVASEPLRERMCGQLMLSLYRCGRQAQALDVYSRVRCRLVEDLGVEPSQHLQKLQYAILNQDASLQLPDTPAPQESVAAGRPGGAEERSSPEVPGAAAPALAVAASSMVRRGQVSILLIRTEVVDGAGAEAEAGDIRDDIAKRVRALVEMADGTVVTSIGSTSLALFGPSSDPTDHAVRAVRAATAIFEEIHGDEPLLRVDEGAVVRAAVTTGEANLRYISDETSALLAVHGPRVDHCQALLSDVPPGEIWVCDTTRQATTSAMAYSEVGGSRDRWRFARTREWFLESHHQHNIERELELDVLRGTLERVRHRSVPHVVTIFGTAGAGKTRLLLEFERRVMGQPAVTRFVMGHGRSRPGLRDGSDGGVCRLLDDLRTVVEPDASDRRPGEPSDLRTVARSLLTGIARSGPVVLIIDNLHNADDELLDLVEQLGTASTAAPLLVIVAACPDLFGRRPGWGGGLTQYTTITLDATPVPAGRLLPVHGFDRPILRDRAARAV